MTSTDLLDRFVRAQDEGGTYASAVSELQAGRKTKHWMWFVFPQLAGLGHSAMSRHFALASVAEARSYWAHPILGPRLGQCTAIVADTAHSTARQIFGAVDAVKLRSCMTLFAHVDPQEPLFAQVLDQFFQGRRDDVTERLLVEP